MTSVKLLKTCLFFILFSFSVDAMKFVHPTDVVKKVKENFANLDSYEAEFTIVSERKDQKKYTTGTAYYKKGGKINFTFTNPPNDVIISNGKKMWVFISRLNAVAVQDIKAGTSGKSLTESFTESGVITLFNRYHYAYANVNQPMVINKDSFYVLSLKEKVASGGFSEMKVYISSETYFITKIEAEAPVSRKVTLTLRNVQQNIDLPNNLFQFNISDTMKVVENALTTAQ
ncbi:MAG: outer membrane lipoprotein carrier protein LolA [Spirochaetia bacterium]|nr:outer membrane lipoprotein carrier protein LolA [Spirochaetia bacterium]